MSGWFTITIGPGAMPWIIMAPSIRAMVALPGMPRDRVGIKAVWAEALLAASGAAMPSIAPLPKRDGPARTRFSTTLLIKAATVFSVPEYGRATVRVGGCRYVL